MIFPWFGTPRLVISDGGPHFIDKTFRQFLAQYGVKHNIATPYHPQTNGQAETLNNQIKNIFAKDHRWDGEEVEVQAPWCTLGISNDIKYTHRCVTLSACIWKNIPFAYWIGIQGPLDNQEMEHGSPPSWQESSNANIWARRIERKGLSQLQDLQRENQKMAWQENQAQGVQAWR